MDSGGKRYSKRIPRCFSREETLRRGYCYSTRVWTDFGLGLGLGQGKDIAVVLIISLQWTKD